MEFDEILKRADDERARSDATRRELRAQLNTRVDELRVNAEAAVVRAVQSVKSLLAPTAMGHALRPQQGDASAFREFAFTTRTASGKIQFDITGAVMCLIQGESFAYQRQPLNIVAQRLDRQTVPSVKTTLKGIYGPQNEPSYSIDENELRDTLEAAVRDLAKL